MKKDNIMNKKVISAIAIGLSAVIATTPLTYFPDSGVQDSSADIQPDDTPEDD